MNTELIQSIQNTLKNYRSHDGLGNFRITARSIALWIEQFEESDQYFILNELNHLFKKCYYNKTRTKNYFKLLLNTLSKRLGYEYLPDLLRESVFLDCQAEGKSQKAILFLNKRVFTRRF